MENQIKLVETRLALLKQELGLIKQELHGTPTSSNLQNGTLQGMKATEVIISFLKNVEKPISKKRLKQWILEEGYPPHRFGKGGVYFYIALKRLAEKGKLSTEGNEVMLMG